MAVVPRSGAHDVPLLWPFQASPDIIKDTTEELRIITAQRSGVREEERRAVWGVVRPGCLL
jgi:hypothetical protein